ncbi:MAG: arginine--tRNA ligase, partial [Bacteroidetes bacterium]|nr:arginine--tRNA ligase [Bacteroidota bacterium]
VYEGFENTYDRLGVDFDINYYESETYTLGSSLVDEGLQKAIFEQKEDGSVWVDLRERNLDEKILRRADGTSLYITQDIGTAMKRYSDYKQDRMIYVVGNEQEYHFQVLFEILDLLNAPFAKQCFHLSYGMVDLPEGRMKSREGNVVDADDIMDEVITQARENARERGDLSDLDQDEQDAIFRHIGLAALKFFIIKVNPQKRMVFNPEASLDLQGQTGPYIQNAYVRIQSIFKKVGCPVQEKLPAAYDWAPQERSLLNSIYKFPSVIAESADRYDPSHVAHYAYDLAKLFHKFYHDISIQRAESEEDKHLRLFLCQAVAAVLEKSMGLLGMEMPKRM